MAKRGAPSKPNLRPHQRKDGGTSYYVRLTFRGRRHEFVIGQTPDMNDAMAEAELASITARLMLGEWRPTGHLLDADDVPSMVEVFQDALPSQFDHPGRLSQTQKLKVNHIIKHLLPYFGVMSRERLDDGNLDFSPGNLRRLDEVTETLVKDYVDHKRRERDDILEMHAAFTKDAVGGDPALKVECPVCHKEPGEACIRVHKHGHTKKTKDRSESHDERFRAARRAWKESLEPYPAWLLAHYGASSRGVIDREIKKHLGDLRRILNSAMRAHPGALPYNPVLNPLPEDWIHAPKPKRRPWFRPEHIDFILRVATELDEQSPYKIGRRAAHAAFIFAGLRNGELAQCDWEWIDWARRRIYLFGRVEGEEAPTVKTEEAPRTIFIVDALYMPLYDWWVENGQPWKGLIWPTHRTHSLRDHNNVLNRLWEPTIKYAIELLAEHNEKAAPGHTVRRFDAGLETRSGRRSFATFCYMAGHNPDWVMSQMGHLDAALALEVYRQYRKDHLRDPRVPIWMAYPKELDEQADQAIAESPWVKLPPRPDDISTAA
jgi:integrase